jgi:hypothetical protein
MEEAKMELMKTAKCPDNHVRLFSLLPQRVDSLLLY